MFLRTKVGTKSGLFPGSISLGLKNFAIGAMKELKVRTLFETLSTPVLEAKIFKIWALNVFIMMYTEGQTLAAQQSITRLIECFSEIYGRKFVILTSSSFSAFVDNLFGTRPFMTDFTPPKIMSSFSVRRPPPWQFSCLTGGSVLAAAATWMADMLLSLFNEDCLADICTSSLVPFLPFGPKGYGIVQWCFGALHLWNNIGVEMSESVQASLASSYWRAFVDRASVSTETLVGPKKHERRKCSQDSSSGVGFMYHIP